MSSAIAKLWVELGADTAAFASDMGKAAHVANKEMEEISRAAKAVGVVLAGAFAAATASMTVLAKQALDSADEFNDLSQKVGMSVEQLSAYSYAAKMSGADTEAVTAGVKKLNQNMVDAARGQGAATAAFEALGISVRDTAGNLKDNDAILQEVADKFAGFEDGATKTALAMDLFGKAGADLIPFLDNGSEGLAALTDEAKSLGVVFSTETAAAAGEVNDNLDKLGMQLQGVGNSVMAGALPALKGLTDALMDENSLLRDAARVAGAAATAYVAVTLALNGKAIALRAAAVAQTAFNVAAKANPYVLAATGVAALAAAIYNYNKAMPEAVKVTTEASTAMGRFELITRRAQEAIEMQNRAAAGMTMGQLKDQIQSVTTQIAMLEKQHRRAEEMFKRGAVSAGLVSTYDAELKQKQKQLEVLNALVGKKAKEVDRNAPRERPPGTPEVDYFDYAAGGLNVHDLDDQAADEGASAAAWEAKEGARIQANIERLRQEQMSKRELEVQDFALKQQQIQEAAAFEVGTVEQRHQMLEALERGHKDRLKVLDDDELARKQQANAKTVAFFQSGLNSMAAGQGKAAKAAQAVTKAQALYKIGIDTRSAAMGAYNALVGIPYVGPALAVAAAGAAIAFGAAQAAAVRSGGGTGGGYSAGASVSPTAAGSVQPVADQRMAEQASKPTQTTIVRVPEDRMMTGRQLLDFLDEALGDGKQLTNLRFLPA